MKKWIEKTKFEKILEIISLIAFCIWILFEILGRTVSFEYADLISCISVCLICVCQTISFWNVKRVISYIGIAGGTICIVAVLLLEML